ncbi:shikimate kinase AroL [Pectobacterium brasiliense]|uniref:Shikimate kinase 2 n=1 Tax=Pectobacterium brasiliense TaxID=180957 RepID=A0A0M2F425_9GAMM|nr:MULTISPECIES: shikimate kinase AroL [Pectobacterium]KGA24967.1 shikimate kinase [Pectobacterium brasiliense]KGA35753.1 shikimate kinase [Pectobacterium brasiliense]KMK83951.1 shikimate kinase II [Pectobacterium brasiliense ICMP 19477]KRF62912.1 shikimate kinase [Pectobacterium brasiliense]MBN3186121.1 shikimate kinase AroL [Pectobacterium brasiliense]
MTHPIFMVGARGCGKTTVGHQLAQALGYDFVDTDLFMQQTTNMTVADVVAQEGWHGFRQRESLALQQVTSNRCIIATGGGMVLAEANRRFMHDKGTVIYLHADAELLAQRLEENPQDNQRPTLTGRPIAEEMADVLAAREALYRGVAHHVIDASQTPEAIVASVLKVLRPSAA